MRSNACHDIVNLNGSFKSERSIAFNDILYDSPDDTSSQRGSQLSAREAINRITAVALWSLLRLRYVLIEQT